MASKKILGAWYGEYLGYISVDTYVRILVFLMLGCLLPILSYIIYSVCRACICLCCFPYRVSLPSTHRLLTALGDVVDPEPVSQPRIGRMFSTASLQSCSPFHGGTHVSCSSSHRSLDDYCDGGSRTGTPNSCGST